MTITSTKQVCDLLGGSSFPRLESPSLRLEKLVQLGHAAKKGEVDAVVGLASRQQMPTVGSRRYSAIPGASATVQQLQSRLIVNQAGGILENAGLCLHRHFGFPYIPGSAVKGVARHYAWMLWHDAWEEGDTDAAQSHALKLALTFGYPTGDRLPGGASERDPMDHLDGFLAATLPELFGTDGRLATYAGSVAFFPAQPIGKAKLVTDLVNCHHPEYYAGKRTTATDDENPIPNPFPAVETGASFEFVVAPVRRETAWACKLAGLVDFVPAEFAVDCLKRAVEVNGIGAKTAAGYGWFEEDHNAAKQLAAEKVRRQRVAREKRDAEAERARLDSMSSEDREVALLGKLERDVFIAKLKELGTEDDANCRVILRALLEHHPGIWDADKKAKPKKKKAFERAELVRKVAARLGVELP